MFIYQRVRCLSEWRSTPSTISRNGWSSTETTSLESTSPFFEEAFHGCQAQSREQSQRAAAGKTEVAGGGGHDGPRQTIDMETPKAEHTLWWTNIAMENHNFSWKNPLFLWQFSIAMLVHQRVILNAFEITDLGCHIHSIRFHHEKGYLTHLSPWLVPQNCAGRRAISTESDSVHLSFLFFKSCGLYSLLN